MSEIKVSPSTLLRHAKTRMTMKDAPSVINAKKFSDLTPAKQAIVIESYKKQLKKEKKAKKSREKKDIYKPLDIDKYKPDLPEQFYRIAKNTWISLDLGLYEVNSGMFLVDEYEDDQFSLYSEIKRHQETINWGVKNGIIKYRPSEYLLAEKNNCWKK